MPSAEVVLVYLSEFFTMAVLLLTVYLVICKLFRNFYLWYRKKREAHFSPRMVLFLCGDSDLAGLSDLNPRWPGDRGVLLKILIDGAENVTGDMSLRLTSAFEAYGFVRQGIRQLRSRRWWKRAEAAYQLGAMKSLSAIPGLTLALEDSNVRVSVIASRALANLQGIEAFDPIIRNVKDASRWASHDLADIFIAMGAGICPLLLSRLKDLSVEAQRMALDILAHFHPLDMGPALLPLLQSIDLEVRARAVKALSAIGYKEAIPLLLPRLEDLDWQVRLLTCHALANMEYPAVAPTIAKRLSDHNIYVRVGAAQTLLKLGTEGREMLQKEFEHSTGRARQWLKPFLAVAFVALFASFSLASTRSSEELLPVPNDSWREWVPPVVDKWHQRALEKPLLRQLLSGFDRWLAYRRSNQLPGPIRAFLQFYDFGVIIYFALLNMIYVFLFFVSYVAIKRHLRRAKVPFSHGLLHSPMIPPISVLVPAFNEENVIVDSVRSFLTLRYRVYEVIVINDGSKDRTLQRIINAFEMKLVKTPNPGYLSCNDIRGVYGSEMYPNLVLIDKVNGGKSDALNAGINFSRCPLFCTVDADSILEPEALLRVVKPFTEDPHMVAVGGVVRIANGNKIRGGTLEHIRLPTRALPLMQIVEYMRAFFSGRMGWSALDALLLISGAFGLFHKETAIRCGGYRIDTVGEDMDLVVRMHRLLREHETPYRMLFIPDPICWTEVPESLSVLATQRNRWQRGLVQTLSAHSIMFLNPKYGAVGLLAYPYYVFFELLGPVIELGGYLAMTLSLLLMNVDIRLVELFFLTAVLFGSLLSVGAVLLEEMSFHRYPRVRHLLVLVIYAFFENFGYRQMNAWWRCKGLLRAFDKKIQWGTMTRSGFGGAG